MSYYVHDIPGRLRVKTPSIKGNHMSAREIEGLVKALPGIVAVTTNPLTGSVVVNYDSMSISSSANQDRWLRFTLRLHARE